MKIWRIGPSTLPPPGETRLQRAGGPSLGHGTPIRGRSSTHARPSSFPGRSPAKLACRVPGGHNFARGLDDELHRVRRANPRPSRAARFNLLCRRLTTWEAGRTLEIATLPTVVCYEARDRLPPFFAFTFQGVIMRTPKFNVPLQGIVVPPPSSAKKRSKPAKSRRAESQKPRKHRPRSR